MKYYDLLPSLPSLFPLLNNEISIMESKYKTIQTTDKYAFGILDGNVWKIELENYISKIKQHSDIKINEGTYEHLNSYLFNTYENKMHKLFKEVLKSKSEYKKKIDQGDKDLFEKQIITEGLLQVWKVKIIDHNKIMLRVFKKVIDKWELTCIRITKFNIPLIQKINLLKIDLITDNVIILITTIGLLIYHFDENKKIIFLSYWNYLELTYFSVSRFSDKLEDFNDFKILL
jgi:hypothetical protein